MDDLLKIIRDENEDPEKRKWATLIYCLLLFSEPINENTARITQDTFEKLQTYRALLRLKQEMPND